jgi:hypothetical protein
VYTCGPLPPHQVSAYLTQKRAVPAVLVRGTGMLCDGGSLREELQYHRKVFKQ